MPKAIDRGVTRGAKQLCPYCGYMFDAHGTHDGSEGAPSPGDAAICMNCSEITLFETATTLRKPTADEQAAISSDADWEETRKAQAKLRAMQRQGFRTAQAERGLGRPQ